MKNPRNFKLHQADALNRQAHLRMTGKILHEQDTAPPYTGITQENYINYRYLETVVVNSVANMSFVGLWM